MCKELYTYMVYVSTILSENQDYVSAFFSLFKDRCYVQKGSIYTTLVTSFQVRLLNHMKSKLY